MTTPITTKICGITRLEDAYAAIEAGAQALGFVFWPKSVRVVSAEKAATLIGALPPFISSVGLFMDQRADEVEAVLKTVPLSILQFHGLESPDFCRQFNRPYIKAFKVKTADTINKDIKPQHENAQTWGTLIPYNIADYHDAYGWMLDAGHGSGQAFDWVRTKVGINALIQESIKSASLPHQKASRHPPIILAGGLNAMNVAEAIHHINPQAVDVSSGVESAPAIKDAARLKAFMLAVLAASPVNT